MKRLVYFLVTFIAAAPLTYGQQTLRSNPSNMESFFDGEIRQHAIRSQALKKPTSEPNIDVKYYKLDLTITTSPKYLRGIVTMHALGLVGNLSTVTLDLVNRMTVDSVRTGNTKLSFVQQPATLTITLDRGYTSGELVAMDIYYRGNPETGSSFTFTSHGNIPLVYTCSAMNRAADWWPCKDYPQLDRPDSVDIWVTADSSFKVGSNGRLVAVINNGNGTKTHRWEERYPICTYNVSIAMTNYAEFTNWFKYTETDSMPVLSYVFPESFSYAQAKLSTTIDMLRIYSEILGLYPFIREKFGHAQCVNAEWNGVSHQTMPSLCTFDEEIVAHELAHMWFDCMITNASEAHLWTNEGFAVYCTALYYEKKYGKPSYDAYIADARQWSEGGPVYNSDLRVDIYYRGAYVLHMLRHVLGDSVFFGSLRAYADDPRFRFGATTTEDFQQVCETVSGKDLGYFFSEWIYGERYPVYTYSWSTTPDTNGGYLVKISLGQTVNGTKPPLFAMPIDFRLKAGAWDTTVVVFNSLETQLYRIHASHQPDTVELDPDNWILHKAHVMPFDKPFITMNTRTMTIEGVVDTAPRIDSTFLVWNIGWVPDSVAISIGSAPTMADSAVAVSPASFVIAPIDSQRVTFSVRPALLTPEEYYLVTLNVQPKSGFGQTSLKKCFQFYKVISGVEPEPSGLPKEFALGQNYPNPFNPLTVIKYTIAGARGQGLGVSGVSLVVYDVLGREVAVLVNERKAPGTYQVTFDGSGLSSGVYFYRLEAGNFLQTKKLVLLK
jgi:aminopeptidase N